MRISFCLITLNEAANLERCLKSCSGLADEIVVVDSGSTDQTQRMAAEFHARWIHQDWLGYVGQKNLALSHAACPWIFSLDADEELSPALRAEVLHLKETGPAPPIAGYSMPRCVLYEGRWIRHGDWYPDRLIRLFQRDRGRFAGGKVHERLEIGGPIQRLNGDLHHYSFRNPEDHRARGELYARLWAETKAQSGIRPGPLAPLLHAGFRLVRGYFLRFGFLDGRIGWNIACLNARESYRKYELLRQLQRSGGGEELPHGSARK